MAAWANYTNLSSPPPGSDIPLGEWRAMDPEEQDAYWKGYRARVQTRGDDHNLPPPGWNISITEWKSMDLGERKAAWDLHDKRVEPGERVVNPKVLELLEIYPSRYADKDSPPIVTVGDL